jgi:mRNA interferase ChpB
LKHGDVFFVSLEPTVGREQRGHRPVLILSQASFNRLTGTPIVAMITNGGEFARRNDFAVSLPAGACKTTGVVRCDQIRSLDLRQRTARYVETLDQRIVEDVLDRLFSFLEEDGW